MNSFSGPAMLGDMTCVPVVTSGGHILLPIEISPLGANGKLYNVEALPTRRLAAL